jgi:hypothetical protein
MVKGSFFRSLGETGTNKSFPASQGGLNFFSSDPLNGLFRSLTVDLRSLVSAHNGFDDPTCMDADPRGSWSLAFLADRGDKKVSSHLVVVAGESNKESQVGREALWLAMSNFSFRCRGDTHKPNGDDTPWRAK